jgi:hypothetical protein
MGHLCSDAQDVVYVLAILAVRDEFTTREDLRDLLHMLGVDATMFSMEQAVEKVRHVLRVSDARSIAIRHNSLREFIAERTQHLQQEINSALVTWYAQNPGRDEVWRHRFRHLFQLGEYSTVLAACDDEWLTRSWAHHRPMHEIQRNLNIAWRAADVQKDVIEYIRIALLKQRVAPVARNLELSDAKVRHLLLDMGRPEEALRRVWDGERPQCGAVEFAEFVLHHAQCIGRVPPQHILEAGLGERPALASPQELRTWYRACAYASDPLELVSEIVGIRWRTKETDRHMRRGVEEDENRALNLDLQLAVVQELAERKDFNSLQRLYASDSVPEVVKTASRAASALVLARVGGTRDAATEVEGLELSPIPAVIRHWLVLELAACGIAVSPGAADSGYPELPTQFLRSVGSELDGQLFSLYDRLRVFFLLDETGYPWLEARTSSLSEPVKTLMRALGLLAHTWYSFVRERGNTASRLAQLKEAAIALDMDRRLFACLDYRADFAKDLYCEAAHRFYDALWSCEVFEQFFDVDAWLDGFVYARTARYFHNRELEKRIQGWIEAAPLTKVHVWEDFCQRRCQGETKAVGLLAVGRRITATEPQRAVDILVDAWKGFAEFFHMHEPLAGEICSAVIRLDQERGCELLFESFRQQYQRYPESIIYELDKLLDFSSALPAFDAVRLYEIWSEHNRRLAAGLSAKPVDVGWLTDDAGGEFHDHCLRYLLDLFEYPVVDLRRLALEQLFLLVRDRHELIEAIIDLWSELSSGQKEHVASLLFSLGIANPASVEDWAPRLVEIAQRERHYNLRATIAEAVSAGMDYGAELDLSLVTEACALKSAPRIVQPSSLLARPRQGGRYPPYLRWALALLENVAPPGAIETRTRAILARLYPQPQQGFEAEAAVHRCYNINTNFDIIEISGDYDRAVREAMNLALHELVQEHSVDEDALGETADMLRLYDPTAVLVRRVSQPGKITWIDEALSDEEFIGYADIDSLKERYALRDERWVSLYENTEQRIGDRLGADQKRANKVHVTVFGVIRGSPAPTLREIDEDSREGALAPLRNRYRFELARIEPASSQLLSGIGGRFVPIVQVSRRLFRGRHTPDLAAIVPELVKTLGLERHDQDLLGYALGGHQVVRSIEWQEAFDQGRRRHEPRSTGFLLEMDREPLSRWADTMGMDLWAHLLVARTTDRYKPESKMDWQVHADVFALRIS